jgi:hypothetical protein
MKQEVNLSELNSKLPPIIAREKVGSLLGGVISPKRLANLDSLGQGPKRMRIGRKVAYLTEDLLGWLEGRSMSLH